MIRYEKISNPNVNGMCTEDEWERLQNHPTIGGQFRLIERIKEPPEAQNLPESNEAHPVPQVGDNLEEKKVARKRKK